MSVRVELRRGADRPGVPTWIRRRDVARVLGPPDPRALAEVVDHRGRALAFGLYSPESAIPVRVLSRGPEPPPSDWLPRRIAAAIDRRRALGLGGPETTGYRAINSEGDALPGLAVDRYGEVVVAQLTTAPMAARREEVVEALSDGKNRVLWTIPDAAARREGLVAEVGGPRVDVLEFREHGLAFTCPPPPAQKTGAFFDQRENRRIVAGLAAARGGPVLDVGCHVGGFLVHAMARGLSGVGIDDSELCLAHARRNAAALGGGAKLVRADMFGPLDDPALSGPFGAIVLDPPRLTGSRRDRPRALAALGRVVARLLPRVAERGLFVLCSCSHHVRGEDLDELLAAAPGAWPRVLALGAGPDHPVWPGHPEGEYLRTHAYQRG